jgi:hypothetical protein
VAGGIIIPGIANNLWDDVAGDESAAGDVEYRGIYVTNEDPLLTLTAAKVWIDGPTTSPDTEFDIALAGEGVNGTMEAIANESTPPAGEAFTRPTTKAAGLTIGDLPAGQHHGIWIRRTVTAGASAATDQGSIRVEGDTAP